jgi:hypothetical protein
VRRRALVATASLVAVLAAVPARAAAEQLVLDLRQGAQLGAAGPVSTAQPLTAGQPYVVTVSGTVSTWPRANWLRGHVCGAPESAPMYPTPRVANGPVGFDADTIYAVPRDAPFPGVPCVPSTIPFHVFAYQTMGLQMDSGAGFAAATPVGGPYSAPRADHTYAYAITGVGAPLRIRFADQPLDDNYGLLHIEVRPRMPCDDAGTCALARTPTVSVAGLAVTGRTCLSRRRFTVRFSVPRGVRVVSARLQLAGRRYEVRAGRRQLTAVVDLRLLPKGTYKLTLRARSSRGQMLTTSRRYRTCVARSRRP